MATSQRRFMWRAFTSVLIALAFLVLVLSGIMLFVSPPGRIANWTNWTLWGLTKHEWTGLHIWFSTLFLGVTILHLIFNWRPLLGYLRERSTRRIGFRWEWAAALGFCLGVFTGTRLGVAPFSSLLSFNERVKRSWEQPAERAPIPHAELLTLAELAERAGVDLATAQSRLAARGITNALPDGVVEELARAHGVSAQQVYSILQGASDSGRATHQAGQGRGGPGGGSGGGPGRKTLAQFCADEGLDVTQALQRLQAKGISASPERTLREIAVDHGYTRPAELLEIIRGP